MSDYFINLHNVTFTYENAIDKLFDSLSLQFETGWTGIVGPNGSGKTTLLKLITGQLKPDSGTITAVNSTFYCEQRTDFVPAKFDEFINSFEKSAFRIKTLLEIRDEWATRWQTLSHGERKRCQIAVALYKNPDILAIDEPSNHLDQKAKSILFNALKTYKGIGLLISHDRELLDNLCHHTLFLDPPDYHFRKSIYSVTSKELENEQNYQNHQLGIKKQEIKKLQKEVSSRLRKASAADSLRSKRHMNKKDHDSKAQMDLARLTGKDATEGKIATRLKSRLDKAQDEKQAMRYKKSHQMGITFKETKIHREFLFHMKSGRVVMGEKKSLVYPDMVIKNGEHIGLIGDNGSGKSTLLDYIVPKIGLPKNQVVYIRQEVSNEESRSILKQTRDLKNDAKGQIMALISRLGSDPNRLLQTQAPSPGEVRKLLLAEGIRQNPGLIIMDEPTNHMDLPSIKCVESALSDCSCALLLVSHDKLFLNNLVKTFWDISQSKDNKNEFLLRVC